MRRLEQKANQIIDHHADELLRERLAERRYKRLDENGRLFGRSIKHGTGTYDFYVKNRVPFRLLTPEEKIYPCHSIYRAATSKIMHPCRTRCRKQSCPYCRFDFDDVGDMKNKKHHDLLRLSLLLSQPPTTWEKFSREKNFAPTKKTIGLLQSNRDFMSLLLRNVLQHSAGGIQPAGHIPAVFMTLLVVLIAIVFSWYTYTGGITTDLLR